MGRFGTQPAWTRSVGGLSKPHCVEFYRRSASTCVFKWRGHSSLQHGAELVVLHLLCVLYFVEPIM